MTLSPIKTSLTQGEIFQPLYDGSWLSEEKNQILKICSTVKVPHIYKGIKTPYENTLRNSQFPEFKSELHSFIQPTKSTESEAQIQISFGPLSPQQV